MHIEAITSAALRSVATCKMLAQEQYGHVDLPPSIVLQHDDLGPYLMVVGQPKRGGSWNDVVRAAIGACGPDSIAVLVDCWADTTDGDTKEALMAVVVRRGGEGQVGFLPYSWDGDDELQFEDGVLEEFTTSGSLGAAIIAGFDASEPLTRGDQWLRRKVKHASWLSETFGVHVDIPEITGPVNN